MSKSILSFIITVSLVFGTTMLTAAASKPNPVKMQRHVDKVKITHPAKYQEMLQKAGGQIEDCLSCHNDMKTKKDPSEYRLPRRPKRN